VKKLLRLVLLLMLAVLLPAQGFALPSAPCRCAGPAEEMGGGAHLETVRQGMPMGCAGHGQHEAGKTPAHAHQDNGIHHCSPCGGGMPLLFTGQLPGLASAPALPSSVFERSSARPPIFVSGAPERPPRLV